MLTNKKDVPKLFLTEKSLIWLSLLLVTLFYLPYLILGENASVTINDNLDSIFVWYKIILDTKTVFAANNVSIPPFMNGITRVSFPSEFNFTYLWFWIFGPVNAYIFERFLLSYIAFFGMLLLLKKYIIPGERYLLVQYGVAVSFALLPHWPFGGLCVPGLPILLFAFLNLLNGEKRFSNWFIIACYPFYSSLITSGFFFIGLLLIILIDYFVKKRRIPVTFCLGILVLISLYIISHYRLFWAFLIDGNYISHRTEFIREKITLYKSIANFVYGLYYSNQVVLTSIIISCFVMWKYKEMSRMFKNVLLFIIITLLVSSLLDSVFLTTVTNFLFQKLPVNLERIAWIYPLLWMILFAISLAYLTKKYKFGIHFALTAVFLQLLFNISRHELVVTSLSIKSGYLKIERDPSFKTFFAAKQFSEISEFIGDHKESYRVLSLGIHPSISQYNGFYTIDGYASLYELKYKEIFRRIIKNEISKNASVNSYFENWGSRAYLYTASDIGYMNLKNNSIELPHLDFDIKMIKQLNGKYILSAVRLNEALNPDFLFLKKFSNADSAWDIYLYKIQ